MTATVRSWMKAGCPVPLNWWNDKYEEEYNDKLGPHKLESMLEFGGSMMGLMMLKLNAGPEGVQLADQLEELGNQLQKASLEACETLRRIGFNAYPAPREALLNFDLPDPRYDSLDEILVIHGLAVRRRDEYRTIPLEYHDRPVEEQQSVATSHAQVTIVKAT